jgi:hypothetical protein
VTKSRDCEEVQPEVAPPDGSHYFISSAHAQAATSPPNYTTYATASYYTRPTSTTPIPATIPRLLLITPSRPTKTTPPRHRSITPQPTLLQPTTPRLPSTTPSETRSTTRLRMLPQLTTPRLPIITLLQLTTPRLPNTTQHPATYLQLHSGCFIVLRWSELLLRGSSLLHQNLRFPSAATLKILFTATQRHPSITPLLRLLRPTVPKLRSIPLPRATTPLRHLNVTSQPMLLQPLCNLKLIFNENKFFNASNYLVRL